MTQPAEAAGPVINTTEWHRKWPKGIKDNEQPGNYFVLEESKMVQGDLFDQSGERAQDSRLLLLSSVRMAEDLLDQIDDLKADLKDIYNNLEILGYTPEVRRAVKSILKAKKQGMLDLRDRLKLEHSNSIRASNLARILGFMDQQNTDIAAIPATNGKIKDLRPDEPELPLGLTDNDHMRLIFSRIVGISQGTKPDYLKQIAAMSGQAPPSVKEHWDAFEASGDILKEGRQYKWVGELPKVASLDWSTKAKVPDAVREVLLERVAAGDNKVRCISEAATKLKPMSKPEIAGHWAQLVSEGVIVEDGRAIRLGEPADTSGASGEATEAESELEAQLA